jgi:phosphoribosyl 1,2-cyclic phosphodiesterase
MNLCVLGSGSKGNCILIESAATAVLIDAGFSAREIRRRLALVSRSAEDLTAVLVTHEHGDHISGVGPLSRSYGLPVHANAGTFRAAGARLGKLHARAEFETGAAFSVQDLEIRPFRISHDTADPVGFVVSDGEASVCCCTDTGRITGLIRQRARHCQALVLEANYDPEMLLNGPYPMQVKQRVRSNQGHLANSDAAGFLAELIDSPLRHVVLAHLSATNNLPGLAHACILREIAHLHPKFEVELALQDAPARMVKVKR